jgi:hypothetical protein
MLTIVFVTLKLCDKITWSWWWVLSPLWIAGAIVLVVIVIFAAIETKIEIEEEKRGIFRSKSTGEWEKRLKEMKEKQEGK